MWYNALVLLCFSICVINAQESLICEGSEKCGECIRKLGCVWCSNPKFDSNVHCKSQDAISDWTSWCSQDKLENPPSKYEIATNMSLNTGLDGEAVQITPQKIKLSLRKGEQVTIPFQYARGSNYPADLYYIMDTSYTMRKHKARLAELGDTLIAVMRNITTDFRLGFGTFIDKPIMPFTAPKDIKTIEEGYVPTYSFKNHLSLTDNNYMFSKEVNGSKLAKNQDPPEGGFDALMQSIVCKDQIGWRDKARRLIVLSTDYISHFAGDGKLGGVYEPNDMKCHVSGNEYVNLVDQDYPSVGQLEHVVQSNNVYLIFAIPKNSDTKVNFVDVYGAYQELAAYLPNSYIGKLDETSLNVVNLIHDIFLNIVDSVRITHDAPSTVEIKYTNNKCSHPTFCSGILIHETVAFNATIKALNCPDTPGTQQIRIKPEGINEALIIDLDVICDCDCESSTNPNYISNSSKCNGTGDEICGVCDCHDGYFGDTCQCDSLSAVIGVDDSNSCKRNHSSPEICSGLGTCKCGHCICEKRPSASEKIYGKYCECDNYSCGRVNGELCGGREHGTCECGKCECNSGWSGEDCKCSTSKKTCTARNSKDGEVCSGRGQCVCAECKCDDDKYFGKYCDESQSDPGQRCGELLECVLAVAFNSSNIRDDDDGSLNCTDYHILIVDKFDEEDLKSNVKICRELDDEGCKILYNYRYEEDERLKIEVQKERVCPKPLDVIAIVAIIISTILLGGLVALVIWKALTHMHDTREFGKFMKNTENSKWTTDQNPIYRQASTTVVNPVYGTMRD